MAATAEAAPPAVPAETAAPVRLLGPQLLRLLVAVFGCGLNFYLTISVVPLYLTDAGWSSAGAGLSTGAMMLATVLAELVVPVLVARFGYRTVLAVGLVLLGIPSLLLAVSATLALVLAACVARGVGLAILFVAGTALVAELVPPQRRGEGLGLSGIAIGVPAVLGLPLGVQLSGWVGFEGVFVLAAVAALAGLAALPGLPGRTAPAEESERPADVLRALSASGLRRPTVVFAATTLAAGVVVTFLPLAVAEGQHSLVAVALFVQAAAAPVARWFAGRYGDRHGSGQLLVPAVLLAAVGAATLVWVDSPAAVIGGMVLFGIGFGIAQNVTLAVMFERVPTAEYGRVSAAWSVAYDAGMGAGAVGFGLVVGTTGYPLAFGLTALILFAALVPAFRDLPAVERRACLPQAVPAS